MSFYVILLSIPDATEETELSVEKIKTRQSILNSCGGKVNNSNASQKPETKVVESSPELDSRESMTVMSTDKIDIWSDKSPPAAAGPAKLPVNTFPPNTAGDRDFLGVFAPLGSRHTMAHPNTPQQPPEFHHHQHPFNSSSFAGATQSYDTHSPPTGCGGYAHPESPSPTAANQKSAAVGGASNKSVGAPTIEHHSPHHQYHNHHHFPAYCEGCGLVIEDPYILQTTGYLHTQSI